MKRPSRNWHAVTLAGEVISMPRDLQSCQRFCRTWNRRSRKAEQVHAAKRSRSIWTIAFSDGTTWHKNGSLDYIRGAVRQWNEMRRLNDPTARAVRLPGKGGAR